MTRLRRFACATCLALSFSSATEAAAKVRVVATLPEYAWAARAVGGDLVDALALCPPEQDAHFLAPRPSYAVEVGRADLFIDTGLDLEIWAETLLEKAANARVMPGHPGYVKASEGVLLVDRPATIDRRAGDVHIFGNPHIHTSPLNMRIVVANVARGLSRVDPTHAEAYAKGAEQVRRDLDERTFGRELVEMLGGDALASMTESGKLNGFLADRTFRGRPLVAMLGGWLGALAPHRGRPIVTYHRNWTYLTNLLGLEVPVTIEREPGVPPSARQVGEVLAAIAERNVSLVFDARHHPREQLEAVAARSGVPLALVPFHLGGAGASTYPELVDLWMRALLDNFNMKKERVLREGRR